MLKGIHHADMNTKDPLNVAQIYSTAAGLSLSTIGNRALNNGRFFKRLLAGHGCTVRNHNRMLQYLSDHWPANLAWPSEIPRPVPSADSPASRTGEAA